MNRSEMMQKIRDGKGFIAALDQSGGSTPKALKDYGVGEGAWSNDEEMFGLVHQMRERIITSPSFGSGKVIGAILFERTMDNTISGKPASQALIDLGIVPFVKIDKGLETEANGVQTMKPIPGLDGLLGRARRFGLFGTKERSFIRLANCEGIAAVVRQQFDVARQVLASGLVPIIEPEVSIESPERGAAERILLNDILAALDTMTEGRRVMLKLTHPRRGRPVRTARRASQGSAGPGIVRRLQPPEACLELARNPGMIASFSRALLSGLRHDQSDAEFDRTLGTAIDEIYEASTENVTA